MNIWEKDYCFSKHIDDRWTEDGVKFIIIFRRREMCRKRIYSILRNYTSFFTIIMAALAGLSSVATADTIIDVGVDLPWSASTSGLSSGTVEIIGDASVANSSHIILFDVVGGWIITNNADISAEGAVSPIIGTAYGSTYVISNNANLVANGYHTFYLLNASNTTLYNYGTIKTLGDVNVDPVHIEAESDASVFVNNYGVIEASYSNPVEVHKTIYAQIYNDESAEIIANGLRYAIYGEEIYGQFIVINEGTITAPSAGAISVDFTSSSSENTVYINNKGVINAELFYFGQTEDDLNIVPYSTTIENSEAGNISLSGSYVVSFSSKIKDFYFINNGYIEAAGRGIWTRSPASNYGVLGTFGFLNNGDFLTGGTGSIARYNAAIDIDTLGSAAEVNIYNNGNLRGYNAAVDIKNADASIPVLVANASNGIIWSTSTTIDDSAVRIINGDILIENEGTISSGGGAAIDISGDIEVNIVSSGALTGATDGIYVVNSGIRNVDITLSGAVNGGSGAGVSVGSQSGSAVTIDLLAGANISATSGDGIVDTAGDANVTLESGSKVTGAIVLGEGNDSLTVKGAADISDVTLLDGGNGVTSDVLGTADAAVNKLAFVGTTQSIAGVNVLNWQTVLLDTSQVELTDGTLVTGEGANSDGSLQGMVLRNGSELVSFATMAITGDVLVDESSSLWHALGGSITGDVTNAGVIYWAGDLGSTLTIDGNYAGVSGSVISLKTFLGDDTSQTDKLYVTGETSGTTAIDIRAAAGSPGAETTNGIEIVAVNGTSPADSFVLSSPVQAGAYQYALKQGSSLDANNWYLVSTYRAGATAYIAADALNAEQGFLDIATYRQRKGNEHIVGDVDGRETWLRGYYQGLRGEADRFAYDNSWVSGLQVGQDIWSSLNDDKISERVALTFDYARINSSFLDRSRLDRGLDETTGFMVGESYSLGATYTRQDETGGYIDVVGKLSLLRNRFDVVDTTSASQNGQRLGISVEGGKPFEIGSGWVIEPQAQLAYLHTHYSSFDDSISGISAYDADALRGRLGARIFGNNPANTNGSLIYAQIDILHDFLNPSAMVIDGTKIDADFGKTWADIGMGAEYMLSQGAKLYGEALYRRAIDGSDSYGYQVNAGLKFNF